MKNLLEKIVEDIRYDELGNWQFDNLIKFSNTKNLFTYQKQALENFIKALYLYFGKLKAV